MRNLKKLFAVIMVVAMVASLMVPALAADGLKYEDKADQLKELGLFKGYSDSDLGLSDNLTREQGLAFMLRVMGLEDEVQAMTAEEVAAEFAKVVDPETVTATWAKPYVAYAIKNGLTTGIDANILPNVRFSGQELIDGKQFVTFMLKGLGYDPDWNNIAVEAANVGLAIDLVVNYATGATAITRDAAAGIMDGFMTCETADGVTLAEALIEAGAVDADKMAEYGYFEPTVAPTEAPVELTATASADNLIQIYVEYSQEVDKTSAEKADNYKLSKGEVANVTLKDDGVTAVITLKESLAQQTVVDVTIDGVKDLDGVEMKKYKIEGTELFDTTPPSIVSTEVAGIDTFKVVFSEPMKGVSKDNFEVNGGKLYVKSVRTDSNNTVVYVEMYSKLKEGDVTLKVKNSNVDYAGFGVRNETFTLTVVLDEEAPVVIGYEKATQFGVTLIWSEDIEWNGTYENTDMYHTNSNNTVSKATIKDGNKLELEFEEGNILPRGYAYVYVLKDTVSDLWTNKNAQQMIQIEVELDETPPAIEKYEQTKNKQDEIVLTFSEQLKEDTVKADNFKVLDKEGKEIKDIISSVNYDPAEDTKEVTVKFSKNLGGNYTLIVEKVEDKSGNVIAEGTLEFAIEDVTDPKPADFEVKAYNLGEDKQLLRVNFGEEMAVEGKYAVNDLDKYTIDGTILSEVKDAKIEMVDADKVAEITIPKKGLDLSMIDLKVVGIDITRVADAAGNYTVQPVFTLSGDQIVLPDYVGFKAEATALNTIKLTFDEEIKFDADDFVLGYKVGDAVYGMEVTAVETELKDSKTIATFTVNTKVKDKYEITHDLSDQEFVVNVTVDSESENIYGLNVKPGNTAIEDKIAPEIAKVDKKPDVVFDGNTITITFTEDLNEDDINGVAAAGLYAYDLVIKNNKDKALRAIVDYTTEVVNGNQLKVTVKGVDNLDDYSVASKASIEYITDASAALNKIKTFDAIVND